MKASRHLLRSARASTLRRPLTAQTSLTSSRRLVPVVTSQIRPQSAFFTTSSYRFKGLQPGSSDPEPPKTEASHDTDASAGPAQITDAEYHEIADQYLNTLVLTLEEMTEKNSDGVEAEFSAGVLTVNHPQNGTYVLNKQPPNRQIWLSSPVSGPKRFDWVIPASSQDHKEDSTVDSGDDGSTGGRWIYLRDGASLSELLKKELNVEVTPAGAEDAVGGKDGPAEGGVSSSP